MITSQVRTFSVLTLALYKDCSTQMRGQKTWVVQTNAAYQERPLEFAEEIYDLRLVPIDRADKFPTNDAALIDDVGFGELERAIEMVTCFASVTNREQVDFVVLQKLVVGAVVIVDADGENLDSPVFHSLLQCFERRKFINTGRAPRCPKIQNDNAATIVTERDLAIRVLHGKVWRGGSDPCRLRAPVASGRD
jgi:hypothetical protein